MQFSYSSNSAQLVNDLQDDKYDSADYISIKVRVLETDLSEYSVQVEYLHIMCVRLHVWSVCPHASQVFRMCWIIVPKCQTLCRQTGIMMEWEMPVTAALRWTTPHRSSQLTKHCSNL